MEGLNYQNALSPLQLVIVISSLCCLVVAAFAPVFFTLRSTSNSESHSKSYSRKRASSSPTTSCCNCACSCGEGNCCQTENTKTTAHLEGEGEMEPREKQTGLSMMEQLVPEITTHALSYLDFASLCRLSMTNSLMRKAANDDNAWKALYHKDFTSEQDSIKPANGWKAYYAATRAVVNTNAEFFNIIRERSLTEMGHFWLNADYVKCFHASGEVFTGYNGVMESWQMAFNWEQGVDFQVRDVRARVLTEVAWVTMKAYVDMDTGPFTVTNIFEFHNGRWCMVHHHSSAMLVNGGAEQHNVAG